MEIGSEFWKQQKQFISDDEEVYLSGRTALDIIVKDAVKDYSITSALLPSYCCHTMIEPFLASGISVRFYDIYLDKDGKLTADVPAPNKKEILYIMKYFGDTGLFYKGDGKALSGWCTAVEDLTHSCFDDHYKTKAEYWFASYRKWFAADGIAIAGKRSGGLSPAAKGKNVSYCHLRNEAFLLKAMFMDGKPGDKQNYLNLFSEAEELLSEDYREYGASPNTVVDLFRFIDQIEQTKKKRRENADVLLKGIAETNRIRTFVDFRNQAHCPLVVPIAVDGGDRDNLRKYLIDREIYCPVHWPISAWHKGLSERAKKIYRDELSLVCDQRYSVDDMNRVTQAIATFFRDR